MSLRQQRPDVSRSFLLREQLMKFGSKEESAGIWELREAQGVGAAVGAAVGVPGSAGGSRLGGQRRCRGWGTFEDFRYQGEGGTGIGTFPSLGTTHKGLNAFLIHNDKLLSAEPDFMHRNSDCSNCRLPLDINYYVNLAD